MSEKKHKPRKTGKGPDAGEPGEAPSGETPEQEAKEPAATEPEADAEPKEAEPETRKSGWSAGELEALRAENEELRDKLLRTVAEMENVRRRTERDKADMAKYAISNFARDVLTVADHIALAIGHVPDEAAEKDPALKSFRDGILVTERELLNVMERHGITRLDPKGERFDPNRHQAMFEVPDPDVPEGTILEVVQAGYVIADRVLRPAMVGVSKGGEKPVKEQPEDEPDKQEPPAAANDDRPDGAKPPAGGKGGGVGGTVDKSA